MSQFVQKVAVLTLVSFFTVMGGCESGFARSFHHHHHHKEPPPPEKKVDYSLNPRQTQTDVRQAPAPQSSVAGQGAIGQGEKQAKKADAPALLLPDHYRHTKTGKLNADNGWVSSNRQRRRYDIGINAPLPQTGDPSGGKTRNVFRRAVPVYEPNY